MKGLCITSDGHGDYVFNFKGESPEVTKTYTLEDATEGTQAQNKAFHALAQELFRWMRSQDTYQFEAAGIIYDFRCPDWLALRDQIKYKYGAGFSHIEYVNRSYAMVRVDTLEDVPDYAMTDFTQGNQGRVKGVLKSWSEYTKKQRQHTMDNLIDIMKNIGVNSTKFITILEGFSE